MFKIAICDDEPAICAQLEALIIEYAQTSTEEIETEVFFSGVGWINRIKLGHVFDIVFLDIEMKEINGIETGKIIRDELKDETLNIIYISGKRDYAFDLFQVRPFDFLIKPFQTTRVIETLDKVIMLSKNQNEYFDFEFNRQTHRIPYKDILYFTSENKTINLISVKGEFRFYGKLLSFLDEPTRICSDS